MLKPYLLKLLNKEHLTREQAAKLMTILLLEENNLSQTAAVLSLMRAKPESTDELLGFIDTLRLNMIPIPCSYPALDIVGTGGDGAHSLNISTGSSILAAACGVKIVKHGRRAVSSRCGSADVLEKLGVAIDHNESSLVKECKECLEEVGITFCFAQRFHPMLKKITEIRKELSVPTSLNLIAPLLNPSEPQHYLMGVYDEQLLEPIADVLFALNTKHSFVCHGNGMDELSTLGPTKIIEISAVGKRSFTLDPCELGFRLANASELTGEDAVYNARAVQQVFDGEESAYADTLILNAAAAVYLYGIMPSIKEAIPQVRYHLNNGHAQQLLQKWINKSSLLAGSNKSSPLPRMGGRAAEVRVRESQNGLLNHFLK
jgi:anthranilate phosphoribosyltransferase